MIASFIPMVSYDIARKLSIMRAHPVLSCVEFESGRTWQYNGTKVMKDPFSVDIKKLISYQSEISSAHGRILIYVLQERSFYRFLHDAMSACNIFPKWIESNQSAQCLSCYVRTVRMAERSKAPDSRLHTFPSLEWDQGGFWSPLGGVGSNPTPDSSFCIIFTVIDD